ncbi:metallophosphoesterase family protein [Photobacterium minamisatsumaniensis]|uniref:metallophosphoesterase family protein n=1 Tax=Photobacterium minamisatsumaniensis TaxID=2910233 RepID=UPI003D0A4D42
MKVFQITDTHLTKTAGEHDANLEKLLNIVDQDPEESILLLTGDLANDAVPAAYNRLKSSIEKRANISHCFALAGNHDDLNCMKACFKDSKIQIKQTANINGIPFHFLDTSKKPLGTELALGAGRVARKEMAALKKTIRKKQAVIVCHHPILDVSNQWFKQIGIENQNQLIHAFKTKQMIISGHAHHYFEIQQGNIQQFVGISSSYGFEHDSSTPQRTNMAGMTIYNVEVTNSQISISFAGTQYIHGCGLQQ